MSNPFKAIASEEEEKSLLGDPNGVFAKPEDGEDEDVSPNPLANFKYDPNKVKDEASNIFKTLPDGEYEATITKYAYRTYESKGKIRKLFELKFKVDGDSHEYARSYYMDTPKVAEITHMMFVDLQKIVPDADNLQKYGKEKYARELTGKRIRVKAVNKQNGDKMNNNIYIQGLA